MIGQLSYFEGDTLIVICEKCGHHTPVRNRTYDSVMTAIRRTYRDFGGRVYPKNVAPIIGYSEYHTREIMRQLALTGKLQRIGERGGYTLPEAL